MAFRLKSATAVQITKELATKYVEMTPAPGDRPLSEVRMRTYRKALNDGRFRPMTWASGHLPDGSEFRVNGKHTSLLFQEHGGNPGMIVFVEIYDCDLMDDVAELYATFDSRVSARTNSDIFFSFAQANPQLGEIRQPIINKLV